MSTPRMLGFKPCTKCLGILPYAKFHKQTASKDGHQAFCKPCTKKENSDWVRKNPKRQKERVAEWMARHPEKMWEYNIGKTYGITRPRYDSMLSEQGNVCAICQKQDRIKRIGVDHDHRTGKVRGLLCHRCNTAIGLLDDDTDRLMVAISYLKKHQEVATK